MFGWIPDLPDERDRPFAANVLSIPERVSLEHRCAPVADQFGTSSCVGQAIRQALSVAEVGQLPASALGIYFNSRAEHGAEKADLGTYNRTAIKSTVRFGPMREQDWPFDASKVDVRPTWRAYRNAHDGRGPKSYHRIYEAGSARIEAVKRALAAEDPVIFGTLVNTEFTKTDGSSTFDRPHDADPIAGGHSMCIIGYNGDLFRIVNSWGTSWRDGGFAWIKASYLTWIETSDLWVIQV